MATHAARFPHDQNSNVQFDGGNKNNGHTSLNDLSAREFLGFPKEESECPVMTVKKKTEDDLPPGWYEVIKVPGNLLPNHPEQIPCYHPWSSVVSKMGLDEEGPVDLSIFGQKFPLLSSGYGKKTTEDDSKYVKISWPDSVPYIPIRPVECELAESPEDPTPPGQSKEELVFERTDDPTPPGQSKKLVDSEQFKKL